MTNNLKTKDIKEAYKANNYSPFERNNGK